MKIGFDFRMGGSVNSGIGRYVFELITHILEIDKNNSYVIFYNSQNNTSSDLYRLKNGFNNVELVEAPYRHYSLAEQIRFPKLLNKYNLDLVHFPNFNVPVLYKKPYVVTIHDMVHHKISGHKKSRILKFYAYKYIIRKAVENAAKIISISEAAKKDIVELLAVDPKKIQVIYEAPFLSSEENINVEKVKNQFLLRRPYFLFVGTLERKKNIITLAKGFQYFLKKYRLEMDLVIAGKPDKHYPEVKYKAMECVDPKHIVFTDFVSDNTLAGLYRGAFAFVTASLHEGFGLPGVEAMEVGLPVLASDTPVLNEVYDNGAIFFNPLDPEDVAEKMRLITQDEQFYKQMQQRSLTRAQIFSWSKTAKETLDVYKQFANIKKFKPEEEKV